ncbi:hypothetical protein BRADI_4g23935v3 [Brachypodium distachyon]|uniref:Uncharacterized protein n=1 Tax=Brachypodium distachyon TaxID=15368 RepID=A0A0Q3H6Z1_BRADI|nr:hypothetical protein BRADI_4g23935v3 [Brachypodium distachyon]
MASCGSCWRHNHLHLLGLVNQLQVNNIFGAFCLFQYEPLPISFFLSIAVEGNNSQGSLPNRTAFPTFQWCAILYVFGVFFNLEKILLGSKLSFRLHTT